MSLDITATQVNSTKNSIGIAVSVEWTGGSGTNVIYRTVNSTDVASAEAITSAIAAGTLVKKHESALVSGTWTDETVVANETYYYVVKNTSESDNTNLTTTIPAVDFCLTDTNALLASSQNSAMAKNFGLGVDKAHVYMIMLASDSAVQDAAIEGLAGSGQVCKKVAYANITNIPGKQPAVVGTVTVKYND